MHVQLLKAQMSDCAQIHQMQVKAFKPLLDKYRDYETNPGAEELEKITQRMAQVFTDYYFIELDGARVGVIRVVRLPDNVCRISPILILPEFQGNGFAQQAIQCAESRYPNACRWELDTIKQEHKLCRLYEKMGYKSTGEEDLQPGMTIISYEKRF